MSNNSMLEKWSYLLPYYDKQYIENQFDDIETKIIQLENTNFTPKNNKIYTYVLNNNDIFTFNNTQDICSFRLYLIMPENIVNFTLPENIVWQETPQFNTPNSLYMLVFQWNSQINKWLANQMWKTQQL